MKHKTVHLAVGVVVTFLSAWLVFRSVPPDHIIGALRMPNYWWLIPNLAFGFLALLFQALRWREFLSPLKRLPVLDVFGATSVGLLINNILPFRLGEYARVYVLTRRDAGLSSSPLLATVLIERVVFDIGFLVLVLVAVSVFIPLHREIDMGASALTGLILMLILLALVLLTAAVPRLMFRRVAGLLRIVPAVSRAPVEEAMDRFFTMIHLMKNRAIFQKGFVLTVAIWLCMALSIHAMFEAFSFDLPPTAAFVLLAALVLAMIVPSLPGYIGIFHLAAVLTLSAYDIGDAGARAFSILLHLSQYIPTTVIGLIFMHKFNLSLDRIKNDVRGQKMLNSRQPT